MLVPPARAHRPPRPAGCSEGPVALWPSCRRGGAGQSAAELPPPARHRRCPGAARSRRQACWGGGERGRTRRDRPPARRRYRPSGLGLVGGAAAQVRPPAHLRAGARPQCGAGARPDQRSAQSRRYPALGRGFRGARRSPARAAQRRARRRRGQGRPRAPSTSSPWSRWSTWPERSRSSPRSATGGSPSTRPLRRRRTRCRRRTPSPWCSAPKAAGCAASCASAAMSRCACRPRRRWQVSTSRSRAASRYTHWRGDPRRYESVHTRSPRSRKTLSDDAPPPPPPP